MERCGSVYTFKPGTYNKREQHWGPQLGKGPQLGNGPQLGHSPQLGKGPQLINSPQLVKGPQFESVYKTNGSWCQKYKQKPGQYEVLIVRHRHSMLIKLDV